MELPLAAEFKPEDQSAPERFLRKIGDAVGLGDDKVGDSLFDDMVRVDIDDDWTMAILQETGAQDAIMEVLTRGDLVEFEPECVYVQLCQEDYEPEELPSLRAGLALVAHITHFAHAQA